MQLLDIMQGHGPDALSRRGLLSILPAMGAGYLGCVRAVACAQGGEQARAQHSWTGKTDLTWEETFRFAYQKDLIPLLKAVAEQLGRERFMRMVREAGDEIVRKKTAGRPPAVRDLTSMAAGMQHAPPIIQRAPQAEIVEPTPEALEYHVKECLWARAFREEDAGDIGYAMICYPDYAAARGLNPKLKLIRTRTRMQGDDSCNLRYVMES